MSTNDTEVQGESDVFGVPTRIGPWALESESTREVVWRRELDETDLDPEDGEEKPLWEWVVVAKVEEGGAWRAVLRKGFADAPMLDRPELTRVEQMSATDEGREAVIEAAIDFMLERGGEVEEETPDEDEIIAEVIAEQEADEIGRWRRVDVGGFETERVDTVLVRWQDRDDEIVVYVGRDVRDGDAKYSARAESIDDDGPIGNTSIKFSTESLETALDEAIRWMRFHRPGVPMPTFSMRIEGRILKPLIELIDRLGGGSTLIEVRDTGLLFESSSHVNAVDFLIPQSDMDAYEVDQEGELTVDSGFLWDALKPVNFGDTVPVSADASEDPVRLGIAAQSTIVKPAVDYFRRPVPEMADAAARFTIDGLEFRDKVNASRVIESDTAFFGRKDGIVLLRIEDNDSGETFTARIDTTSAAGEQLVVVNPDRLQALRRAMPRPSQTPISFALHPTEPMLAEYTVGETDVDVRIALKTGAVPIEIPVPPEEVVVPEGAETPEPEADEAAEEAMAEFVEAAAEERDEAETAAPDESGERTVSEADVEEVVTALGGAIVAAVARLERAEELGIDNGPAGLRLQDALEDARERHENLGERPPSLPSTKPSVLDRLARARGSLEALRERTEELLTAIQLEEEEPGGVEAPDDDDGEPPTPPDERDDEVRSPISIRTVGGNLNYVVEGTPPGRVEDEAISAAIDTLGQPGEFVEGIQVGEVRYRGTSVERIDLTPGEAIRSAEVEAEAAIGEPEPEPEEEPEPDEREVVDEPERPDEEATGVVSQFTRKQVKETVEAATVGTQVTAQVVGSKLREIKIRERPDSPAPFRGGVEVITTLEKATPEQTIQAAIENWEENVNFDDIPADALEAVNEMRGLVGERLDVSLPRLSREVPPPEEPEEEREFRFSEREIEEIIDASIEGANLTASINPDADSLRIRWDVPPGTGVRYVRDLREVQGQASEPVLAIIEAIEEWQEAVALSSVDAEILEERRENEAQEFGIDLPTVPRPDHGDEGVTEQQAQESIQRLRGEERAQVAEASVGRAEAGDLAERIRSITHEFQTVPIETEELDPVPGFDLPVEVDQQSAELLDEEGVTSVEQALEIHHTDDVHEDIHAAIATVLDAEPENFYDSSQESALPGYDRFYSFDMSRSSAPGAWTNRRFDPSTLFRLLEPFDGSQIQVVSSVAPLA